MFYFHFLNCWYFFEVCRYSFDIVQFIFKRGWILRANSIWNETKCKIWQTDIWISFKINLTYTLVTSWPFELKVGQVRNIICLNEFLVSSISSSTMIMTLHLPNCAHICHILNVFDEPPHVQKHTSTVWEMKKWTVLHSLIHRRALVISQMTEVHFP